MTIKHIVISGGGPTLIQSLAAIQHLEERKFLDMKNIESIYGTSAGAVVGTLICLKYDWETINDYIIKRPWHDVFPIKVQNILDAYTKKGLFDGKIIEKCFKPLLDAKDVPLDINLSDFYKYSNIELHFFTFDINEYKINNISYLTHPELSLIVALQMTCALPVLVTPVFIEDKCYVDGGIACNYPLNYCIESGKEPDEILGIKNNYNDDKNNINLDSTILDFLLSFLFKALFSISIDYKQPPIKHEVICDCKYLNLNFLKDALSKVDVRKTLFTKGIESATTFLEKNTEEIIEKNTEEITAEILEDSVQELCDSSL